jgi:truncated hemoglobin YjbI
LGRDVWLSGAYSLANWGVVADREGDQTGALALLEESLALRRALGDRYGLATVLEGLAGFAKAAGQPRRGAQLWGAADALREAQAMPRPPREQAEYDSTIWAFHGPYATCYAAHTPLQEPAIRRGWSMGGTIPTLASPPVQEVDLYAAVGGSAGCRALAEAFYALVAQDPRLRPLFPGTTFTCAIAEFTAFLAQLLGGPPDAAQRRHWLSLRDSHRRFPIGPPEQAAWLHQMHRALDAVPLQEPVRRALREFFARSAAYLVNREPLAASVVDGSDLGHDAIAQALARRWEVQRGLDMAVAAVREGDAARAIAIAQSAVLLARFQRDRSVWAALLAVMIASGHSVLMTHVHGVLSAEPALAQARYSGRTLLHGAAAAGSVPTVTELLRQGADPNALDMGGHTPLYDVANACREATGAQVVHTLARAGASVNAAAGVTRCTALHMAARRGNAAVAAALLDCGAEIEARDSRGDTPLRRAVNCGQPVVAALLLARGADRQARGSRGLTPYLAARSSTMKRLLHSEPRS